MAEVGREGAVDVRLQIVEVDLDDLVVVRVLIGAQVLLEVVRQAGDLCGGGREAGQTGQRRVSMPSLAAAAIGRR